MKAQFSQDHIQPVAVQQPHFQLQIADQATRIVKSPESAKPDPNPEPAPHDLIGTSTGGAGPGIADDLPPEVKRSKSRLENAQSTLHQLADIFSGVIDGMVTSGYDPSSTRNNQRLLKGAISIAKEVLSHAEADGESLFRIHTANLYSKSLAPSTQVAVRAYGVASQYVPRSSQPPLATRRAFDLIQSHVTGPQGFLSDLQYQADNGPHSTDRVRQNLNTAINTLDSLQSIIDESISQTLNPKGKPFVADRYS